MIGKRNLFKKGKSTLADIKTHLRELSVALGIKTEPSFSVAKITPLDYFNKVNTIISNNISRAKNILTLHEFDNELRNIINNGLNLGKKIVAKNLVNPNEKIIWTGFDTQKKDPIDLYIGSVGFSLKEDSYILENMGLYKYLNLMTNSNFSKGLHIFEHFACDEYNAWFQHTWSSLLSCVSKQPWIEDNSRYKSEIQLTDSMVLFKIDNKVLSMLPAKMISIQQFIAATKKLEREKVFAKWINSNIKTQPEYLKLKNNCSIVAGQNMCSFVNNALNPVNIARLLQVYENDYFYAKSTNDHMAIFHVPNNQAFLKKIKIQEIKASVPASQLNILTKIENIETGNCLVFRNECRFSHGQFNGVPEAKMYYEKGNDLSVIYNRVV